MMMDAKTKADLHSQLVKLGDMMGDGLHHEPDGKWISREYRKICRALGYIKNRPRNTKQIDEMMQKRVREILCPKCTGLLTQTRKGSMRAKCGDCGTKFQLLKASRSRKGGA